ncbi:MAG: hypothetical protein AAF542_25475 [Pseudomonadota bacterium]
MKKIVLVCTVLYSSTIFSEPTKNTQAISSHVYEFLAEMQSTSTEKHWWAKNGSDDGHIQEVMGCLHNAGERNVKQGKVVKYVKSCMKKKGWDYEPV